MITRRFDSLGCGIDPLDDLQRIRQLTGLGLLLGLLGADGHTASIFPGTRAVSDLSSIVLAYQVPQLAAERMTLTLPVLNHAHHILFLVAGQEKAHALATTLEGERSPSTYPAQAVRPVDGTLTWLVDQAAAAELTQ